MYSTLMVKNGCTINLIEELIHMKDKDEFVGCWIGIVFLLICILLVGSGFDALETSGYIALLLFILLVVLAIFNKK